MKEEEEKAIKTLKEDYELAKKEDSIDIDVFTAYLGIALNLIETQKAEIEKLEKQSKNLDKEAQAYLEELMGDSGLKERTIAQLQAKLGKKDKAMGLMAEQLTTPINDKKWVIEYYTKLAEENKQ